MTIQLRKWTPWVLPLTRRSSGATFVGWSVGTCTIDPRTASCMGGMRQGSPHQRLEVPPGVVLAERAHLEPPQVGVRRVAGPRTHTYMRTVDGKGSSAAASTSRSSAVSRSSSSGRRSQTSWSTCPGGTGSTTSGFAVSQGWRSVQTTPWGEVLETARLVFERRRACSKVATVGAALLRL